MPFALSISRLALISALLGVGLAPAAHAQQADSAGAYLAARAASSDNDYAQAAGYYDRLLGIMPGDRATEEGALLTRLALGQFEVASTLAAQMVTEKEPSQLAVIVTLAERARQGDFAGAIALLDSEADAGQLTSGLFRAWALVGLGQMSEASKAFDVVGKMQGLQGFAGYHKALALALVGDFEGAEALFSGELADVLNGTRRGVMAHVQVLSQLERDADAIKLIDDSFGAALDPELSAVRERLAAGEALPFTTVTSALDGTAEVLYSVAQALNTDAPSPFALLQARVAHWLRPDHVEAILLSASILEAQEQYDLAIAAYALIAPDQPSFHAAELGRADAMVAAGRNEAAIEVLEQLTRTHAHIAGVWIALGDNLRREERYKEAAGAYDKAIELRGTPQEGDWFLYYARGIAEERAGAWDKAEVDFREALKLNPDQPSVLNYLGYTYVEKRQNLDEALGMIEKAVAERPEEGYIVDSLAWALYRLGRYGEAVVQMERAVELVPADALLNDHLGDVYWAVGRAREAEFQWRRALNFGPAPDLSLDRVRRKLEVGLDVVLKEEGAAPLHPADAGN